MNSGVTVWLMEWFVRYIIVFACYSTGSVSYFKLFHFWSCPGDIHFNQVSLKSIHIHLSMLKHVISLWFVDQFQVPLDFYLCEGSSAAFYKVLHLTSS